MPLPAHLLPLAMAWLSRPMWVTMPGGASCEGGEPVALPAPRPWPVIFTACNWYNEWKLPLLLRAARDFPSSPLLLVGGLGRLASPGARALGAEAYEMQRLLLEAGVDAHRIMAIGCRECAPGGCHCVGNTGFNTDRLLERVAQNASLRGRPLLVVEESFLARRTLATVLGRLRRSGPELFSRVELRPSQRPFAALAARHGRATAAGLLAGEVARLGDYCEGCSGAGHFRRGDFLLQRGDRAAHALLSAGRRRRCRGPSPRGEGTTGAPPLAGGEL